MLTFTAKGDFTKTQSFLTHMLKLDFESVLHRAGEDGVKALSEATPKDTGLTSKSWTYELVKGPGMYKLIWKNSNKNKGVPIALLIQYGHGTGTGGYVPPVDYINPALEPIFEKLDKYIQKYLKDEGVTIH